MQSISVKGCFMVTFKHQGKFEVAKMFAACLLALTISAAMAEPVSDRITVMVRGHGPDVVLIPGIASSSAVWDMTVVHLEDRYRLHIVQINGFAGSPSRANGAGPVLQPVTDALDAYIKANHLKSPAIIGHSFGGTVGMMLALEHPEDVSRLMVVATLPFSGFLFGGTNVATAEPIAAKLRNFTIKEPHWMWAHGEKRFIYYIEKSPDARETTMQWVLASDKAVVARASYDDLTTDLRPELQYIKTPVTVLFPWYASFSYNKSETKAFYEQNFAGLPHKTVVGIDGSSHFIMLDQPDLFQARVDQFLEQAK
jgi:pimeloyl-ACP methyl ester carboxylesterase